ncbi:MAG: shikimate dehydrogenase [Burkholderiales bacterium]|nr:shikimate dehydrogenase [Burkholderiales bacterium]
MADKYAVIGNPVAHSRSPEIHAAFARETGQDIAYGRILAPLDGFAAAVRAFREEGGRGLNVTLPFKHEAWNLVDRHSPLAMDARAVNTIEFREGSMRGHNTDGIGLVRDLVANLRFAVGGRRVLLMGAGGATYGVLEPLLREHPRELIVANRTFDKARALVAHFANVRGVATRSISARPYGELPGASFDLVLNATSAGLRNEMPPLPQDVFAPGALAYDMVYGRDTPFLRFARERGARTADGLGMLVEQAAESFYIWRRRRPSTAPVIAALRAKTQA